MNKINDKNCCLSFFILSDVFFTKKAICTTLEKTMWGENYCFESYRELMTEVDFLNLLPELKTDILFLDTRLLDSELKQIVLSVKKVLPQSFIILLNDSFTKDVDKICLEENVFTLEKPLHMGYLVKTIHSIIQQISDLKQGELNYLHPSEETFNPIEAISCEEKTPLFEKTEEENCQNNHVDTKETENHLISNDIFEKKREKSLKIEETFLNTEEKNTLLTDEFEQAEDFFSLDAQSTDDFSLDIEETSFNLDSTIPFDVSNVQCELSFDDFYLETNANEMFKVEENKDEMLTIETNKKSKNNNVDSTFSFDLTPQEPEEGASRNEDIFFLLNEETENDVPIQGEKTDSTLDLNTDLFSESEDKDNLLTSTNNNFDCLISFDLSSTSKPIASTDEFTLGSTSEKSPRECVDDNQAQVKHSIHSDEQTKQESMNFNIKKSKSLDIKKENDLDKNSISNQKLSSKRDINLKTKNVESIETVKKESFEKTSLSNTDSTTELTFELDMEFEQPELLTTEKSPSSKNEYKNKAPLYNETTPSFSTQDELPFNLSHTMDSDDQDDEIVITPPKAFYPSGVDRQTQRLNKVRNQHQNQWGPKK